VSAWQTAPLGKVATLQRGFDLPARLRRFGSVPIVSSSGVSGWHDHAMVNAPGVVTGRYGTIGEVFYENVDFWPLNTTLWVSDFHGNDKRFVYYLLQCIDYETHSGKSGIPGVNRNDLHNEFVKFPKSLVEQRAIAEALDDADAWITSLEALIAKKEAIKQGMMQELLTGRTRLPGFTELWGVSRIGDYAEVKAGGTPSTSVDRYWGGQVPWMSSGEIHRKQILEVEGRITSCGLRESSACLLPPGTVLIALAGQGKTRGTVAISRIELSTNQSIAGILPNNRLNSDYLFYNLDSRYDELRVVSAGDGGRGGLNQRIVCNLEVPTPPIEEQRAIAAVLCDVDVEIAALGSRLTKARDIKQGMMQELLSGRTRLPVGE